MLTDDIEKSIKRLEQLYKIELAERDAERKGKNDEEFSNIVEDCLHLSEKILFATNELDFALTNEMLQLLSDVPENLENVISAGVVDKDELNMAKKNVNKKIIPGLKKEWKVFYEKKVSGVFDKLSTIDSLVSDKDKISTIETNISNGKDWDTLLVKDSGVNARIELLKNGITEVDEIEESLDLSDEIKDFIISVTRGRAKVTDINDSIVEWIKRENLEGKFAIKFRG